MNWSDGTEHLRKFYTRISYYFIMSICSLYRIAGTQRVGFMIHHPLINDCLHCFYTSHDWIGDQEGVTDQNQSPRIMVKSLFLPLILQEL